MDIHVDIRGFLEIHAWICYGFSDQGAPMEYPFWLPWSPGWDVSRRYLLTRTSSE